MARSWPKKPGLLPPEAGKLRNFGNATKCRALVPMGSLIVPCAQAFKAELGQLSDSSPMPKNVQHSLCGIGNQ